MTIETFLVEYGGTLLACYGAGFGLGYLWVSVHKAIDFVK